MNSLKYITKLPKVKIVELLSKVITDEPIQNIELIEDEDSTLLVASTRAVLNQMVIPKTYVFNDYQLLSITTPIDKLHSQRTNLNIESITRLPIRQVTLKYLEAMNEEFENTNYLNDAQGYYESFETDLKKINKKNEKIIRGLQYKTFKGDYKKAINAVLNEPSQYGFVDIRSMKDNNRKILNFIESIQDQKI